MNIEKLLAQLMERLIQAFGEKLKSALLYGSAASGQADQTFSDLNVLCVLTRITPEELAAAEPVFRWWREQGSPSPLLLSEEELAASTDCFPIEFRDIQAQHRVLHGADLVKDLRIDDRYYRAQVEYQLRSKMLRLRQKAGGVLSNRDLLMDLLLDSVSTFCVLARHALVLGGHPAPHARRDTLEQARSAYGIDPAPFLELLDVRERKRKSREIDAAALFAKYLRQVEALTRVVDQAHSARGPE